MSFLQSAHGAVNVMSCDFHFAVIVLRDHKTEQGTRTQKRIQTKPKINLDKKPSRRRSRERETALWLLYTGLSVYLVLMVATLSMTLTGNDVKRRRYTQRIPMSVDPDAPLCECGECRRQKHHGGYRNKCWTCRSNNTYRKRRWGRMPRFFAPGAVGCTPVLHRMQKPDRQRLLRSHRLPDVQACRVYSPRTRVPSQGARIPFGANATDEGGRP